MLNQFTDDVNVNFNVSSASSYRFICGKGNTGLVVLIHNSRRGLWNSKFFKNLTELK